MNQRVFCALGLTIAVACSSPASRPMGGTGGEEEETGGKGGAATGGSKATGGSGGSTGGSGGSGTGGSVSTGGSGGSTGGSGGSTGGAGGDGGSTGGAGGMGGSGGVAGGGPAGAFHDLVVKVPCPTQMGTGKSCNIATEVRAYDKPVMIGGTAGTMYKVKLKVCAVYEGKPYTGCMTHPDSPKICINGTPGAGGFSPTYPTLGL